MKITFVIPFLLVLGLNLGAQQPGAATPAPGQKTGQAAPKGRIEKTSRPAASEDKKAQPVQKKEPAKAGSEQDIDDGGVVIDSKAEDDYTERPAPAVRQEAEKEESLVPGGIPSSYGRLKGVLNDAGRNFLVFEADDGAITMVQVFVGKNAVSWKHVSTIRRSED